MPNIDGMYVQNADGTWSQNMQLTGRNVKLAEVTNITVSAGSQISVTSRITLDKVTKIYARVRANASHAYDLNMSALGFSFVASSAEQRGDIAFTTGTTATAISITVIDVSAPVTDLKIKNNDTVSHSYDAYIGGIN